MFYAGSGSYIGSWGYGNVEDYMTQKAPVVTYLTAKDKSYTNKSATATNVVVAKKDNANYTVKLGNSDGNNIVITKNGNHNIQVGNGQNNDIFIGANYFF